MTCKQLGSGTSNRDLSGGERGNEEIGHTREFVRLEVEEPGSTGSCIEKGNMTVSDMKSFRMSASILRHCMISKGDGLAKL